MCQVGGVSVSAAGVFTAHGRWSYAWPMAKKAAAKVVSEGPAVKATGLLDATCRIAVLHGDEAFLRSLYTQALKEDLEKAHGTVDVLMFDGATARAAEVLDECRSYGLIASHKLVVVDNAAALVKDDVRPMFERYAESPLEGATLVLRSDLWRPGNLDKAIAKVGLVKECKPLTEAKAIEWASMRAQKRHRSSIDRAAAAALIDRIGTHMGQIESELAKLAAAAGDGNPITVELINELVGVSREEEVWGIQQTLLAGNAASGLAHLAHLVDISREPAERILWAFTDLARKLHGVSRGMASGQSPEAISKALKLWGPSTNSIISVGRRLRPPHALALLEACVEAAWRSRSGLGDSEDQLERLVLKFSASLAA